MTATYKGYYLPPSLEDVERSLELTELSVSDATILVPRVTPEEMSVITRVIRENNARITSMSVAGVAETFDRVSARWRDGGFPDRKAALRYLPALTNLSPELIEYFHFQSLDRISGETVRKLSAFRPDKSYLEGFLPVNGAGTFLRGYAGLLQKLQLKTMAVTDTVKLITYITPSNVPGLIECMGMLMGCVARASVLVKTPSAQPFFAPAYARSVAMANPDLGETIAVIPWQGGNKAIEEIVFGASDAISVISSADTVRAIKATVGRINQSGRRPRISYHGGKFGLDLIARDFADRDVAGLAAIDGIGYEGYMCASPAFGYFVETGGPVSPEAFAGLLAEEAGRLSRLLPQTKYFRRLRERKIAELLAGPTTDGQKIFTSPGQDFAVVYEPVPSMKPVGQDRLFRVMPVDSIEDVIPLLKPWKEYLQTAGIAVDDARLIGLGERLGKAGISSIRCVGTVPLPVPGEAWDGCLPVYEYYLPDAIHWVSINTTSIEAEIGRRKAAVADLKNRGAFPSAGCPAATVPP